MSSLENTYALYQKGMLQDAQENVLALIEAQPDNAKALHLAGLIFKAQNNFAQAHHYLTRALQLQPNDPEALNTLGNIFQDTGDMARAKTAYKASLAVKPAYEPALKNLAFLHLKDNRPLAAIEIFTQLLAAAPKNEDYRLGYANALKDSEQAARALEELDQCKTTHSAPHHVWLRGLILFDLGRYDEAIALISALYNQEGFEQKSIALTAQILHMQGQWKTADKTLKDLIKTHSASAPIQSAAAKAYMQAGDNKRARTIIKKATAKINDETALADLWALRAQLGREQHDYKAAYRDALAALAARPGDIGLMQELALCAIATERNNDALHIAQTALQRAPNDQFWIAVRATAGRADGQNYKYYYDYEKFVRAYHLKPPKGYSTIEAFNHDLKIAVQDIHSFKKAPLDQSVRGGIQTSPNLIYHDHPVLKQFFQMLDEPLTHYLDVIGHDSQHPLLRRNKGQYRIYSAWSVLLSAGGHHVNHIHPQGWISSSYYIDVPDGIEKDESKQGWIQFGQPPFSSARLDAELQVAPKAGQVILFPSYMWHGTIPIKDGVSRMTLPFDVVPE